jgi:hypothetical protein
MSNVNKLITYVPKPSFSPRSAGGQKPILMQSYRLNPNSHSHKFQRTWVSKQARQLGWQHRHPYRKACRAHLSSQTRISFSFLFAIHGKQNNSFSLLTSIIEFTERTTGTFAWEKKPWIPAQLSVVLKPFAATSPPTASLTLSFARTPQPASSS